MKQVASLKYETHYHNAMIQKIFDSIELDNITRTERYDMFEEYGRREYEERKIKYDRFKALYEVVQNFLAAGIDIELISKNTGLTISEIETPFVIDEELDDDDGRSRPPQ
ncbi:MAG: hypothetical protein PHD53_10750 [Methylococcales bacterium]|nr:hypothetical protein [Methylococcales bacterium]